MKKKHSYIIFLLILLFFTILITSGCSMFFKEDTIEKNENIPHTNSDPNTSFTSEKQYSEYATDIDYQIADSFNISLNDYIKVETKELYNKDNSESNKIVLIYNYITKNNMQKGDIKPSAYLNKDNKNKGIIILRKSNGTDKLFFIQLDKSITYKNPEIGIVDELEISR